MNRALLTFRDALSRVKIAMIAYLRSRGFRQDSPVENHNDVMFVREDVVPPRLGLNLGSGQRRFESVEGAMTWVNVDATDRPPDQRPDLVQDIRARLPFPDECADYVVLHHVLEHFGCGEADGVLGQA